MRNDGAAQPRLNDMDVVGQRGSYHDVAGESATSGLTRESTKVTSRAESTLPRWNGSASSSPLEPEVMCGLRERPELEGTGRQDPASGQEETESLRIAPTTTSPPVGSGNALALLATSHRRQQRPASMPSPTQGRSRTTRLRDNGGKLCSTTCFFSSSDERKRMILLKLEKLAQVVMCVVTPLVGSAPSRTRLCLAAAFMLCLVAACTVIGGTRQKNWSLCRMFSICTLSAVMHDVLFLS